MRSFLDTNILIYGLVPASGDQRGVHKSRRAVELIDELAEAGDLVISSQVMSEFFVVSTRKAKSPLAPAAAALVLDSLARFHVVAIDSELVVMAAIRMAHHQIGYWDSLIVEAALRAKVDVLYSEDMQYGMKFEGLRIVNPFLDLA